MVIIEEILMNIAHVLRRDSGILVDPNTSTLGEEDGISEVILRPFLGLIALF